MPLFSPFNFVKDYSIGAGLRLWFNQTKKRYGTMTSIKIDSTAKTIHVELDLKGETSLVVVDVKNYALDSIGGETFIEVGDIETSREWLNALLSDYLKPGHRRFAVPAAVKALL